MNLLGLFEHCLSAILLCNEIIFLSALPNTNVHEIERKFVKHRSKAARKVTNVGAKLTKNLVELDPVCGKKYWDLCTLCIKVAERLYPGDRIAIGSMGNYKKSDGRIPSDTCTDGKVILTTRKRKKPVHIKMFKCAMSSYIFEKGFEMRDFYIAASSSMRKVYVLRDYYDENPLHEDRPQDHEVMTYEGIRKISELEENVKRIYMPVSSMDSVSSTSVVDDSSHLNSYEYQQYLNMSRLVKTSKEGVFLTNDGMVLVRLYAFVGGMRLKRIQVRVTTSDGKKRSIFTGWLHKKPPKGGAVVENHE